MENNCLCSGSKISHIWSKISVFNSNGELTPLAVGAVKDFHDTWDLDGTDYMPQLTTTVGDEGYWDLDGTDIQPLDV